jgi:hypothetical protein
MTQRGRGRRVRAKKSKDRLPRNSGITLNRDGTVKQMIPPKRSKG